MPLSNRYGSVGGCWLEEDEEERGGGRHMVRGGRERVTAGGGMARMGNGSRWYTAREGIA